MRAQPITQRTQVVFMAHDIHDDGFHEIQLSGKQLVFLFMATTVVSIVIFLCGVLVGRGTPLGSQGSVVDGDNLQASASLDPRLDETPAAPQSNTPTTVEGLSYPERLQRDRQGVEPVAPPPAAPATRASSTPEPVKAAPAANPPPPAPAKAEEARQAPAAAPTAAPTPASTGGFTVQVTALKARADADAIAERLQSRGYRAYVVAPEAGGQVIYKVRVGMNMERPEAEQIMTRLKTEEKFQPWITR